MEITTLKNHLNNCQRDILKDELLKLDASIMTLHQNGFYVVGFDPNTIKVYNGEFNLSSFNNKIDYLNSGYNENGDKKDILEICAIGICAYNRLSEYYINKNFLNYIKNILETISYKEVELSSELKRFRANIPDEMFDYYCDVFVNGNIDYLNNYLYKKNNSNNSQVSSNSYKLTKSTQIGKQFSENDAAYVNVLLIPAMMVLIYLIGLMIVIFS